jgi:hypothetical protein
MCSAAGAECRALPAKVWEVALEEQEKLLNATEVAPETAQLLAEGMLQLLSGLAVVTGDREVFKKTEAMKEKLH